VNPGSSKQLREYFELDGREDWPKTPAGAPKTDQDAMKALLEEDASVAKWVEWKRVEKLRSTYSKSLQKHIVDGRIHARFNPFGAGTGRFSSSTPNLQNIPKRGELGARLRGALLGRGGGPRANQGGLRQHRAVGGGDPVG
jgi:DNA polymerase-1